MNLLFLEVAASGTKLELSQAGIYALLGYAVVFTGLLLLMIVLYCSGAIFKAQAKKKARLAAAQPSQTAAVAAPAAAAQLPAAPGTAGQIKLYTVSDKEAAMIMAIVADQLQKPLNELRFLSIKEVETK